MKNNSKRGFSLIIALIILVLMATILTLALSLSSQSVKQTSDIYLKAQAEVYARSVTEYALLAISGNDISANCVEKINLDLPPNHEANLTIMYLGDSLSCNANVILSNSVVTPESNVTVIIDTVVSTKASVGNNEPIRIHRRTIQKP